MAARPSSLPCRTVNWVLSLVISSCRASRRFLSLSTSLRSTLISSCAVSTCCSTGVMAEVRSSNSLLVIRCCSESLTVLMYSRSSLVSSLVSISFCLRRWSMSAPYWTSLSPAVIWTSLFSNQEELATNICAIFSLIDHHPRPLFNFAYRDWLAGTLMPRSGSPLEMKSCS
jgi:hypothetical protein